jgi:Domain of unknown function (DUF4397)
MRAAPAKKAAACVISALTMLLAAPAVEAFGAAQVRLVNAVSGDGAVDLTAIGDTFDKSVATGIRFGQTSSYQPVQAGSIDFELSKAGSSKTVAKGSEDLENGGKYTAVAFGDGTRSLQIFKDGGATGKVARVRVINAARELGDVDIDLNKTTIAKGLSFEDTSPYESAEPGTYDLSAMRPSGSGGALVEKQGLPLTAGTSTTAVIAGSGGKRSRFIILPDGTVAPGGPPKTGLGGLAHGDAGWALVLLAALGAGALGGAAYLIADGRGRRRHQA